MRIKHKNKQIKIEPKKVSQFGKFLGLMFKTKDTKILLFENVNVIHSLFVFFPFLAVWLDNRDKTVDFKVVKPFNISVSSDKPSAKLLEIPISKKNINIINFFVGKGKV